MQLTGRGWAVLGAAGVLLAAGVAAGLPLLRALAGVAAGAVLVAVVAGRRHALPSIRREVHPVRLQCGERAVARLVVGNDSRRLLPAFVARDAVGGEVREVPVRALAAGARTWEVYDLPTTRRGRVPVGPLVVERADVLGLVRSRGEVGEVAELWVYPRRHAVRLAGAGSSRHHHEGGPPPWPVAGSTDLRALREYVPGDALRLLHWKASARTGRLVVRDYTDPVRPWCVVLLDDRAEALPAAAFEEAVELTASILWEACEQDRPVRLATASGVRVAAAGGAAGARAVLDRLCVVEQVPAGPVEVTDIASRQGDGWFVHVGGPPTTAVAVTARRFGSAALFDLSGGGSTGTGSAEAGTICATSAAAALRTWNALVQR